MCSNRSEAATTASAALIIIHDNDTTKRQAASKQTNTHIYIHTFQVKHITAYFRRISCWHIARNPVSLWPYGEQFGRCRANESVNRNVKNLSRLPTANDSRADRHALTKAIQRFTPQGKRSVAPTARCCCYCFSVFFCFLYFYCLFVCCSVGNDCAAKKCVQLRTVCERRRRI